MPTWNSSPHPISDVRDWNRLNRLELRPDFQRKSVWNVPAKIMLIDSILKNIPMPKIFLSAELKDGTTYRIVIDGQQRITSILEFLDDHFSLDEPYTGPYSGLFCSQLPDDVQSSLLQYKIDFCEISNANDQELREIFQRVNKYTVPLNAQELRIADFPGDFQDVAKTLSNHPFFDDNKIFTAAHRRRSLDIEYVSELLIVVVTGITNKKEALDKYYKELKNWDRSNKQMCMEKFKHVLSEIDFLNDGIDLKRSRFKQKSDFYTLFSVVVEYVSLGQSLKGKPIEGLIEDLKFLDSFIAPESHIGDLKNYAIKCVSQANSASSREWRKKFIRVFFNGVVGWYNYKNHEVSMLARIALEHDSYVSDMSGPEKKCCKCGNDIDFWNTEFNVFWPNNQIKNLSSIKFCHYDCQIDAGVDVFTVDINRKGDEFAIDSDQERLNF